VYSCETTVGIVFRINLHFDASGAELCGHLVEVANAKVDHPNLTLLAKIFRCFREGREHRRTCLRMPRRLTVAGRGWGDSQVNAIPLCKRLRIVCPKEQAAYAEDSLGGQTRIGSRLPNWRRLCGIRIRILRGLIFQCLRRRGTPTYKRPRTREGKKLQYAASLRREQVCITAVRYDPGAMRVASSDSPYSQITSERMEASVVSETVDATNTSSQRYSPERM
jgi:hypothetical protein